MTIEKEQPAIIKYEALSKLNSMDERESYFAGQLDKCSSADEDIMRIYHHIKSNGCKPIQIERAALEWILQRHGENGWRIVSGEMLAQIESAGYTYLPVYTKLGEQGDYEPHYYVLDGSKREFLEAESLYINPIPCTLNERIKRDHRGEIMVWL